ncbi:MAG: GNAT family N-acetyltransferase [Bacteriovoracaceae bacterium]
MNHLAKLRPMNQKEYLEWSKISIEEYANEKKKANGCSSEEANNISRDTFQTLLPDGLKTKDHFHYVLEEKGIYMGSFWFHLQGTEDHQKAFIYDVKILEEFQGKGYGRLIMTLGENEAKKAGAKAIRLHVFGSNSRAINLYQSLNYITTDLTMMKALT